MIVKYKLSDLARDLNVSNKQIIDLLAADGSEPKKSSANLTDTELNLVFEHFTSTRQVENFNAYFASAEEAKLAAEKKAAEEKAAAEAAKKAAEEKAAAEAARKARRLERALECEISDEVYAVLEQEIEKKGADDGNG